MVIRVSEATGQIRKEGYDGLITKYGAGPKLNFQEYTGQPPLEKAYLESKGSYSNCRKSQILPDSAFDDSTLTQIKKVRQQIEEKTTRQREELSDILTV